MLEPEVALASDALAPKTPGDLEQLLLPDASTSLGR
jgi:hypothetical protein